MVWIFGVLANGLGFEIWGLKI